MRERYLVTGGTGFLGAALVGRLVQAGHAVRVLDNNSRGEARRLAAIRDDLEIVEGDIRDPDAVVAAARGVDRVVHLAFVNGTQLFYAMPQLVLDVGIRGMLNVLDACRSQGVGQLFVASSSEVYQDPPKVPTDESAPLTIPDVLNPRYSYAGGKIVSELMAIHYGSRGFDRVVIFRPHNVYGPDMGWEHVLPQFVRRTVEQIAKVPNGPIPFQIQDDGTQTRAFIHIDDFTQGLLRVIEKGEHRNIYHIGNPQPITIADVAHRVVACLGREAKLIKGPPALGSPPHRCPDITKLAQLGFDPRIDFDQGLPPTVRWYATHTPPPKSPVQSPLTPTTGNHPNG